MTREGDTIPIPRIRTVVLALVLAGIAWNAWSAFEEERAKDALWNTAATSAERVQAAEKYAAMGRSAVPKLLEALDGQDARTRELAALALARIGSEADAAVPKLLTLLSDPDQDVQLIALRALQRIGHPVDAEVPVLVRMLSSADSALQWEAAAALVVIGSPAIGELCELANSAEGVLRRQAVAILSQVGEGDPRAAEVVHRAIADPDARTRLAAFQALVTWDELRPSEARAGLRDADREIARTAATHVPSVGRGSGALVPELIALIHRRETREPALGALAALGSRARVAVPDLVVLLEQVSALERPEVLRALGKAGRGELQLVPLILPHLESDRFCSHAAAEALRRISPAAAREAAVELAVALRGTDAEKRVCAAAALDGIGRESASVVNALIAALDDESTTVRFHVAGALQQIGKAAEAAIPRLVEISRARPRDSSSPRRQNIESPTRVQVRAVEALGSIGEHDALAIGGLTAATRHPAASVRSAALDALQQGGVDRQSVEMALIEALHDRDGAVRARAALWLGRARVDAESVVPLLKEIILADIPLVQKAAAAALGAYGVQAQSAAYLLHDLARQPEDFLDDEERAESELSDVGLRYETSEPLYYLARRSVRSTAIKALKRVDPTRRA